MKKVVSFIICLVLAIGLYLGCRDLAVAQRGTTNAYGGEVLVPFMVMLGWFVVSEWEEV
jgi:hypothetical protein